MDRQDRSAAPESAAYLAHLAQQASHLDGQGFTVPAGAPAGVAPLVAALNDLVAHLRQEQADLAALNTALARARDDAAAASRAKSTFLANMSHELRTPLNAILGFTEMMLGGLYGPLAAEQEIRLTRILTNGQNLLALINEALDLTRIEAGKLHLHLVEIDPGPLLR
ncbi:MAG TPA: histidine kinase dimerization/phospho-acceptor domain-containing protein, partial [Chloroflexia bacterium]|nr:histidine kinase dimerization/phospho-acceptor domain-containing protein [Chloroflexia bacterium]